MEKKQSIFLVLKRKYPEFRVLSSNRFSQLNRVEEMYPIIRRLRNDYPNAIKEFRNYPIIETETLGKKIYNFIKNNIN